MVKPRQGRWKETPMAHTFTCVLMHMIFSTKERKQFLTPELGERLFPYMGGIIRDMKGTALLINGPDDHVHILTSLPTTIALSDFMKELKAVSSGWVNDLGTMPEKFNWQTGYAAFSVSKSGQNAVRAYIEKQQEHHREVTFKDEYLEFLKRHEIEYDERFVFD
jgi:REP element-mobilizing transposase RayT